MYLEISQLSEPLFEPVLKVLDTVARERRFLPFTEAPGIDLVREYYRKVVERDCVFHVALVEGNVVGWCDVLPVGGQAREHVGILGIGLVPEMRSQGIGRRLIEFSIARALAKGITRIELTVRADNLNARALYDSVGFESEGLSKRAFRIDGEYFDTYAMAFLSHR